MPATGKTCVINISSSYKLRERCHKLSQETQYSVEWARGGDGHAYSSKQEMRGRLSSVSFCLN